MIMITKLLPPRISSELIERPRLLELFTRNPDVKMLMVTAPAGYGKTISTLQYVNTLRAPFVWYQLDHYDNDPAVFLQYLISGIQNYFPGFGTEALQLALQGNITSSLHFIVISIVNELAGLNGRNLVLVLDDYHTITTPLIHQFIEELLEHLPAAVRIILTSRIPPNLPLSRFQVRGEVELIDSELLRFTTTEVNEFLSKRRITASQQWMDSLISKTDGWPAALKLLTEAAFGNDPEIPAKETKYIYDYLASEVFDRQPEEIRQFLLSTSVLEIITPDICDSLLDRNDSGTVLNYLEKRSLFLTPLSGQQKAYRYHQLFRDFLSERLGSKKTGLLGKAGAVALNNGNLDQAIEYYIAAGINQDLLSLLEQAGKGAFRQGRWQTVERWLGMLSEEQISADQWLSFFQGQIKIYQGKLDEAEIWLSKSSAKFSASQDAIGIAECQFLQARILNGHGRNRESLEILEKAYPVLQKSAPVLRFDLPLEMALTLFRNGRFQEAKELLTHSLRAAEEQNDSWIMAHLLEGLGHTYYFMGEHTKALQCYQKGIRISPNQTLPSYNYQDFIASIYQEWGELDFAFEYAQRSVTTKENLGMIEALPSAYYQLGVIYVDFGELEKAEACYRKGIHLAENGGERHFLSLNKAYLARCLEFQGRLADSLAMAEQVLAEAQAQSETLLASCQIICAPTFIKSGNIPKAREMLLAALPPLEQWGFAVPLSYGYGTLAVLNFKIGNLPTASELSRKLLDLAARKNFIRLFLTIAEYRIILRYGMENGIEVSFIQRILVRMRENGINILTELSAHPDPKVRVRTVFPLSQINTPASQELLAHLSNDPDPEIRKTVKQYANLTGDSVLQKTKTSPTQAISNAEQKDELLGRESTPESENIPLLQIHLLGPVRIILNNVDITTTNWRFTKSRDLLLYLCHQGQPVGIGQILEDLWPDLTSEKGMNYFHTILHKLRQIIQKDTGVELIAYASKICQLLPTVYTTDRERFISLINAGSGDIKASDRNLRALEEAVTLYQGDYLSQLDYPWVIPEREHLKRLYLETALRLARFYLQNMDYLKVIEILASLADQNPLHEEIFALLMTAYAKSGDRLAVIRQYQKLKSNLADELGLEPTPEITKLYYELCSSHTSSRRRLKKA